ncbi:AAA family ATPase [Actinoplanes sp. G11-F43]|uniref:AAA family ATPase n=1 Tax=Actinoplanes sp. G11-F43 TaxID=3424130 RepID=UPI003D33915F
MSDRIVGRTEELKVIRTALEETKAGRGGCHVFFGRPGIGKSRLLLAAGDHADRLDVAVAAREAFRHDRTAPLVTLAGALRACSPPTAEFAWLSGLDDEPAGNYAKIHRLRDSLERFAAVRPLLIVIDDAHWMDELSALAVRELVPALESFPVRWLLASRTERADTPGRQTLDWLSHRITPTHLDVLDGDAVRRLCEQRIGARVDDTVLALVEGCGGYPLRIEQLIGALTATRQIIVADGIATVVGDDLPSSFVTTVREIVGSLSPDAQWLLRATSVLDGPIDLESAARLMGGLDPAGLFGLVDEAVTCGLLVEDHTGLVFRHAQVHQAVQSTLSPSQARHLHGRAAVLAREQNRPAAQIAGHLLRSGRIGAGAAVGLLRDTAAEMAATAPAAAADLMLQACAAIGEHDPQRPALVADTVGALASAGRLATATELGRAALRGDLDPAVRATIRFGLATAFRHAGRNDEAADQADAGLADPAAPREVRAHLHAIRAHALVHLDDPATADESGATAVALGREIAPAAAVSGLTARSLIAQAEGRLADALGHAEEATGLAGRAGTTGPHRIRLAGALTALGRFDEADRALDRGHRECAVWAQPLWHHYRSVLLTARGRLDDAAAEAEAGVTQAEQYSTFQPVIPLLGTLIRLAVLRGDLDQGRYLLFRIRELTAAGVTGRPEDVVWAEASLLAAEGDPVTAFRLMRGVYDSFVVRPALLVREPEAAAVLVRLARTAGDGARAEAVASAASRLACANPDSWAAAGAADHAAGTLTKDPARLRAAVRGFRLSHRPVALASALADAAGQAWDAGDRETAREWYEEALVLAIGAGAHGVHRRLRDGLGGRLGAVTTTRPAEEAPVLPTLSPAERPVALLVAQGMTNIAVARRLNLSPHTVDSHLRKVFQKLEIRSRVELAALVAREGRD